MKHISLFLLLCTKLYAQPISCSNDVFAYDSTQHFMINEIKPFGPDRFVELWNCRDAPYHADRWYVRGMYSNVMDSFDNLTILAHDWLVLSAPAGLRVMDAVQIIGDQDTICAVMYTITDTVKSIGLCQWYHQMTPTPGADNDCNPVGIIEPLDHDEVVEEKFYDILGQEVHGCKGLCVAVRRHRSGIKTTSMYWR